MHREGIGTRMKMKLASWQFFSIPFSKKCIDAPI
jgi:hypothetical protein